MNTQDNSVPITNLTVIKTSQPVTLDQTIQEIYDQIARRAYELYCQRGYIDGFHHDDWLIAESELLTSAPISIHEEEDAYSVHVEVPGFSAEQIEVQVEPTRLLIQGNAEQQNEQRSGRVIYSESRRSNIFRVVSLPGEVEPQNASASVKDGILFLTLPKAAAAKAANVEVKAAAA